MRHRSRTRSFGLRLLAILLLLAGLTETDVAWAVNNQKRVLVVYATRRDSQLVQLAERELPELLEKSLGDNLDYYSEYLDQARFDDATYQEALSEFLRHKYGAQRFDAVIAIQDGAIQFVDAHRSSLFPDSPIVFYTHTAQVRRMPNSTGVVNPLHLGRTLDLALALQPDLRHVFLVTGADERDRVYERLARAQLRPYESKLDITYLSGLAAKDLEGRLRTLPGHSAVYYILVYRDGAGANFHPLNYLDRVTSAANAPTYSWTDSTFGRGVLGGSVFNQQEEIEAVAGLTVRVLRGEPADGIPVSVTDLYGNVVDWRQLQRWGISEARVPSGTVVRYKNPSAWAEYKVYILGAAVLMLAQTALIAGLLVQMTRRRQAEDRVMGSQAELRTSYERIRDLGARLLSAQESERTRIARELHDDISQQVALLTMDLELAGGTDRDQAEKLTDEALNRAHAIAKSLHDLSHRLHPAKLRLIGLVAALHSLQRELSQSEIPVTFAHDNVPPKLPPDLTLCLFRIAQEALQNALKYSKAHEVSVHLSGGLEGITLAISDDGVGFDVATVWGQGLGLISMAERLEAIGGTLKIHSAPGAGTRLDIKVPLDVLPSAESASV